MRRGALLPADKLPKFDSDVRLENNFSQAAGCHKQACEGEDVGNLHLKGLEARYFYKDCGNVVNKVQVNPRDTDL